MRFILIAMTFGDGPTDYGHRLFAEEFRTRAAAEAAKDFIDAAVEGESIIVEDAEAAS